MRVLADYVLRTRTDERAVSAPAWTDAGPRPRAGRKDPVRIAMGFSAVDAGALRAMTGQEGVLVTNIRRPGEALARLRLVEVDPRTSRLVAEVLATEARAEPRPAADRAAPAAGSPRTGKGLLVAGAVLGLLVLGAIGWALQAPADRRCTSSMDCAEGFACAPWVRPSGGDAEYRSCERECRTDRDCPGAEQCMAVDDGPTLVRVCRSDR
jgi:hypothetical protein